MTLLDKRYVRGKWIPAIRTDKPKGKVKKWFDIAKKSESNFRNKIQPLPDYDTFCDGMRER